jgi:hypothetical protein
MRANSKKGCVGWGFRAGLWLGDVMDLEKGAPMGLPKG